MNDSAPSNQSSQHAAVDVRVEPRLNPAPGRCIIRIVPRLLSVKTEQTNLNVELDGRFENQPMVGQLFAMGDPTNEREKAIADWAVREAEQNHMFVFSQYGAGSPYWNEEMRKMIPAGFDFRWLQGLRLFDIAQLACTIENSGTYGEAVGGTKALSIVQ